MRFRPRLPIVLIAVALLAFRPGVGAAEEPPVVRATFYDPIDAFARHYAGPSVLPGMATAIGLGDAPTQFHAAGRIDFADGAPEAGADSLWRIYSMTKPITGIAAMILVEDGRIALDQPIADFIPAFRRMRVLDDPDHLTSHPAAHPITVRMLLTHSAGLGYDIVTKGPLQEHYRRLGLSTIPFNAITEAGLREKRPPTLKAFAERVATLPLIAEPGSRWSYSCSMDVLGRVIEVASGMPFDRFVSQRILGPLRMDSTYFQVPARDASRLATNYIFFWDMPLPFDPGAQSIWLDPPVFPYGGAGLVSSARDYDRFLHMLEDEGTLDGVRILKPETARLAMSNLLPAGAAISALSSPLGDAAQLGFGAGGLVYLSDVPGGPGKGTFGWAGAAGSLGWVDRLRKVRAVMMVNYLGKALPLQPDFAHLVYARR